MNQRLSVSKPVAQAPVAPAQLHVVPSAASASGISSSLCMQTAPSFESVHFQTFPFVFQKQQAEGPPAANLPPVKTSSDVVVTPTTKGRKS